MGKCRACHDPDTEERSNFAPGLKRLFKRPALPVNGLPVTPENVIKQLKQPMGMMPSFASLQEDEIEAVLAYLNSL
jgi:cytochrome c2